MTTRRMALTCRAASGQLYMRTVSEITPLSGGRYLIILEDGISFPLYRRELDAYGIETDRELSEADYCEIMQELLPKRARLKAMHLLEAMDRTESQLRRKLEELRYPEEIVTDALGYVKGFHYIDDLRYAVRYLEFRREGRSMRQLMTELYQKGIPRELIEQAAAQVEPPDEEQQVRALLLKKHYDAATADRKETERMYRFLARRGYSPSVIREALALMS